MSEENFDPYQEAERLRKENNLSPAGTPMQGNPANTVKSGKTLIGCGTIFAFFPLIVAMVTTAAGSNMWNESDPNSGGAGLWALIVTLPIGFIVGLIGLIMYLTGRRKLAKSVDNSFPNK